MVIKDIIQGLKTEAGDRLKTYTELVLKKFNGEMDSLNNLQRLNMFSRFEIYILMVVTKDLFEEEEDYEMCARIVEFLKSPEMIEIQLNSEAYAKDYIANKKLF